jgi:hypothetical protein
MGVRRHRSRLVSARALAAKAQPGSTVRWDRLEKAGFAGHASVLAALEGQSASSRRDKPRWQVLLAIPIAIVMVLSMLAPILGVAAIARGRFQEFEAPPEEMIPLAGLFYAWAAVALVVWLISWMLASRQYSGVAATFAVMTVVLGVLTAITMADRGVDDAVPGWEAWLVPVIAATVIGAVFAIALVVAKSRGRAPKQDSGSDLPPNKLAQLQARRSAVAELGEADRLAITSDLEAAIADLERRGLIDSATAERARSTELGGLALRMSRA